MTTECMFPSMNDLFPTKFQLTPPPPKKKVSVFWKILTVVVCFPGRDPGRETLCNNFRIKVLYSFYSVGFSLAGIPGRKKL